MKIMLCDFNELFMRDRVNAYIKQTFMIYLQGYSIDRVVWCTQAHSHNLRRVYYCYELDQWGSKLAFQAHLCVQNCLSIFKLFNTLVSYRSYR